MFLKGVLMWTFLVVVGGIIAALLAWQLLQGAVLLTWIVLKLAQFVFGPIFKTLENALSPSSLPESEGELLTEEFKVSAKGKMAPDMWTDGRRLYFEVGNKSYSVPPDLEAARSRKNELLSRLAGRVV